MISIMSLRKLSTVCNRYCGAGSKVTLARQPLARQPAAISVRCLSSTPVDRVSLRLQWKELIRQESWDKAVPLLIKAMNEFGCTDASYTFGVRELEQLNEQEYIEKNADTVADPVAKIKADIAKVRKPPKLRGSKADFEKFRTKQQSGEFATVKSINPTLVVHSSKNARLEREKTQERRASAMALLERAAEQGHLEAMCYLGNVWLAESLDSGSLASVAEKADLARRAVAIYESASTAGSPEASFNLGVVFHDGLTVEPSSMPAAEPTDVQRERSRRKPSAEPEATVEVVPVDLSRSLALFERSAAQGDPGASLWCGHCYSAGEGGAPHISPSKAVAHLQQALGHASTAAKAHFHLAQLFRSGVEGSGAAAAEVVQADESLFLRHLRSAVEGGDPDALYVLADLHLQRFQQLSSGEESQLDEAAQVTGFLTVDLGNEGHYGEAHQCGNAQCDHDHRHDHAHTQSDAPDGVGTKLEKAHLRRAVVLMQRASELGQADATLTLGALAYHGLLTSSASAKEMEGEGEADIARKRRAFELYSLAAEQGSLQAWRNIASMHFLGDGVPRNEHTAREIMRVVFGKS